MLYLYKRAKPHDTRGALWHLSSVSFYMLTEYKLSQVTLYVYLDRIDLVTHL